MTDESYVYATAALIVALFVFQVTTKKFDPFAPVWLFLVGYVQLYVIQAATLREWGIGVRGIEVITAANLRILWALILFLTIYYVIPGKWLAGVLPGPPEAWSVGAVATLSPFLVAWGLVCAYAVVRQSMGVGDDPNNVSAEVAFFRSFPFVMMVAGVFLIVSGRQDSNKNPMLLAIGLVIAVSYVLIWTFNGKRSHSLIGLLSTVCAFYISKKKRPSWPVLIGTAVSGALVVTLSIGWRNNPNYDRTASGFIRYVGDFQFTSVLKSLNLEDEYADESPNKLKTYESQEYGGYLLMLDTVPEKSDYDYGANYLRTFSTFIPRLVWPDKPIYGRDQWIKAWQAGSEMKREDDFTGPAIGLHGATQLNGGAVATFCVFAVIAVFLRTCYEYFRKYDHIPWIQAWWALSYFNAWFMVVNDDPMIWFYYNWGFTTMPSLLLLWGVNKVLVTSGRTSLATA